MNIRARFRTRGRGPRRLAALALVPVLAACAPDAPPGTGTGADPAGNPALADGNPALAAAAGEARAAIEAYVVAMNALDIDSAGTFYSDAPDFQWLEDGVIRYGSARESRESLAGLGAMASSATLTLADLSVTPLSPGIAVATCHFVQEIGMGGGPGFSFSGAMTIVLRREGGRWRFASGHTSSVRSGSERP